MSRLMKDSSEINPVEFVVKNTNYRLEPDDTEEEIPEVLTSGSIIRDFDNDGEVIPPVRGSDKYNTSGYR